MRGLHALSGLLALAISIGTAARAQGPSPDATLFEGARLIDGRGGQPIEDSAFLVENGAIAAVGRKGRLARPARAARVDLSGKTVIPALIDAHSHIGYMKNL